MFMFAIKAVIPTRKKPKRKAILFSLGFLCSHRASEPYEALFKVKDYRSSDENRRVGSGDKPDNKRECERTNNMTADQEKCKTRKERAARGNNSATQPFIQASVYNIRKCFAAQLAHIFTDAIRDNDRVVHG